LEYLETHAPPTIDWELTKIAAGRASIIDRHMPAVASLVQALEDTWGKTPVFRREGGSVPIVAQIQEILGVKSVLTGFGLPDDNLHAPNEKFYLPNYHLGIQAMIRYLTILGENRLL
jgi:acetylornithine deacetylase/succinyl-diaminopimelate desuccinylase-like protein